MGGGAGVIPRGCRHLFWLGAFTAACLITPTGQLWAESALAIPNLPPRDSNACVEPGPNQAPVMVVMPPGRFQMGSPQEEKGRRDDEGPQHEVTLPRPFAISRCEITRGQFRRFVQETKYRTTAEKSGGCYRYDPKARNWNQDAKAYWDNPGFDQDDRHPVVCVSWGDANEYARWLSQRTGALYRLPTEAEWEYAARAGSRTSRCWGDDPEQGCAFAKGGDASLTAIDADSSNSKCDDHSAYTAPVGDYRPNAFGLYDMIGNVWEWTADCWHDNYQGAPIDGSAWDEKSCDRRVVRGGSWFLNPQDLRSALRSDGWPVGAINGQGFRLARAL